MGPFLARLRASLSASSSNSASPATTMADALPAPADRPPPPPSSASLKRRGSLGAGLALLRARPGAAEPQPESQASRTVALAVVDDRPPRVDLLLPDKEAAGPPTVSPARSAEAVRKEEDAVLANLRLKPDEVAGLVRRLCGKLSERGLDVPGLYLSAHLPAVDGSDGDEANLSVAERALLLAWVRLHRPGALSLAGASEGAVTEPSSLGLPAPSPAYLLDQEFRYFESSAALAHLVLWVAGRLQPSPARDRWFAAYREAERAGGFTTTAWTNAAKEGEEKRLFQALAEGLSEAAAWERTTGVGLPTLARLVGFSLFRSSAATAVEANKGPAAPVEALLNVCETAGAKVEHLIRAYLRDQVARGVALPTRLLPLIERFPAPLPHSMPGNDELGSKANSEASSSATSTAAAASSSSRLERALVVVIAAPEGDAGALRPGAKRMDPTRLGTWAIHSVAARERRPDRAGLGAEDTWQKVLASATRQAGLDTAALTLDDVFTEESTRLARKIARLHPSAREPAPTPAATGKTEEAEPIYRPFPKSTSTFFSPSVDDLDSQPISPASSVAPVATAAAVSGISQDPQGSDWAAFSSFGFDGSSPAQPEPTELGLGAGLALDLGTVTGPPRRLNARSLELERILQGADAGSPPKESESLPAERPAVAARAQLLGVSLLKMSDAIPAVLAHALLDPDSVGPSIPTVATFEVSPAVRADVDGPRWVLVAVGAFEIDSKLATGPTTTTRLPASSTARPSGSSAPAPPPPPPERRRSGSALVALFSVNPFGRRQSVKKAIPVEPSERPAPATGRPGSSSLPGQPGVERRGSDTRTPSSTSATPSRRTAEAPVNLEDRLGAVIDISRAPSRPKEDGTWTPPTLPSNIGGLSPSLAGAESTLAASFVAPSGAVLQRSARESAPSPETRAGSLPMPLVPSTETTATQPSDGDTAPGAKLIASRDPHDATTGLERLTLSEAGKA